MKFRVGSWFWQTPEESQRTYQLKRCGNNNKDEVESNSPKTFNDRNHQALSQKFVQLILFLFFINKYTSKFWLSSYIPSICWTFYPIYIYIYIYNYPYMQTYVQSICQRNVWVSFLQSAITNGLPFLPSLTAILTQDCNGLWK